MSAIETPADEGSAETRAHAAATEALNLMTRVLAILDASEAPADAGAHVDHAMHRVRQWRDRVLN